MTTTAKTTILPGLCCIAGLVFIQTASAQTPVLLHQSDFDQGTYQITRAGTYRLAEDISFNPHPVGSLAEDGQTILDAYHAGKPFPSQLGRTDEGKYDPAAFGVGFFAAIAISAPDVTLDLNGHKLEQSAEHSLLQRFFAVIEAADQPFVPGQGPAAFGAEIVPATKLTIRNGTVGRSSHHGIHGNGNQDVVIQNVDFVDFEVAAVSLNGVTGLRIINSTATNREDVPVIGTFSNARFIADYVDYLVSAGSSTTLTVQGRSLGAADVQAALRDAINAVHEDVISNGRGFIDNTKHPGEYALFHNKHGIVDGNSYGYLVNPLGVATGGFPFKPAQPARDITLQNVHILSQHAFINEVVALRQGNKPVIDPIGAVFMVRNQHPSTGAPLTVSSPDDATAHYTGNVLANAQALVAKAALAGEFPAFLDVSRLSITPAVLHWIESGEPLASIASGANGYFCNGDTMFHVNKGVIGFKMDGAADVVLRNTSAHALENLGVAGSQICGAYQFSHPQATLPGYGGAKVRGYSFAGATGVTLTNAEADRLKAAGGSTIGFDVLTDTTGVSFQTCSVNDLDAGYAFTATGAPNEAPAAAGIHISASASGIQEKQLSTSGFKAFGITTSILDDSVGGGDTQ